MDLKSMRILNTRINNLTWDEVSCFIQGRIASRKPCHIVSINTDQIIKIEHNPVFRETIEKADLSLTDGTPIMWVSWLNRTPVVQKMPGPTLAEWVMALAAQRGYRVFLLGAAEGVAAAAAERMRQKYPGLCISGVYSPPYGFETNAEEIRSVNTLLKESRSDILILGLSSPKQELFCAENQDKFDIPVALSLGAAIDFMSGRIPRAPEWVNRVGLEWLFRFLHEPRRLFKRYFIDDTELVRLYFKYRRKGRGKGSSPAAQPVRERYNERHKGSTGKAK